MVVIVFCTCPDCGALPSRSSGRPFPPELEELLELDDELELELDDELELELDDELELELDDELELELDDELELGIAMLNELER